MQCSRNQIRYQGKRKPLIKDALESFSISRLLLFSNNSSTGIDIKEKITGGSILESDTFINWVRDKFLPEKSREIPAVQRLKNML